MLNVESFAGLVTRRRATRRFRPEPVPHEIIARSAAIAQRAPSNCNTQPWEIHVVSGAVRERLQSALIAEMEAGQMTVDFPFRPETFPEPWRTRHAEHGAVLQAAHGVSREDLAGRRAMLMHNLSFFGAPHAAFFFMPGWGNERQASDVGMFAQTFALALAAADVDTCPQAVLSYFADTVRHELGVGSEFRLLYGMSIGYTEINDARHRVEQGRAPLAQAVRFHG